MTRAIPVLLLTVCTVLAAGPGRAADAAAGEKLVAAECTFCHGDEVYTATTRKVDELEKLQDKVDMCTEPAGVEWDAARQADVVEYLNRKFYQFK